VLDAELVRASFRLGAFDFLDAERWRTDIGAAIQSINPQNRNKAQPTILAIALIILTALGYLFLHR
jgi:hypothetical protein